MNSVRIAYMLIVCFFQMFLLVLAIITPIYFTVGYYWWSVFLILLLFLSGHAYGTRLNSFGYLGKIDTDA